MSEPTAPNSDSPVPSVSAATCAWCGVRVALVGSVLVGLVECIAAGSVALDHYSAGAWPWGLLVAIAGKTIVTHVIFWCPLFALVGLVIGQLMRRHALRAPEAVLIAAFVLLAGWVIAPADLQLAERYTRSRMILVCATALIIAVGLFWGLRRWARKRSRKPVKRLLDAWALGAVAALATSTVVFLRSPLYDPGTYRVPPPARTWQKPSHPHVLWIVMDTVRADHTSLCGYARDTTPKLADFAKHAIVFNHAVSNGIWTLPNHASMFTGRSLRAHGTDFRHAVLDTSFETVAQVLGNHGYATAVFSNNPWVAPDTQITRGFDTQRIIYHLRHVNRSSIGWGLERCGASPIFPWLDEDFGGAMTNALVANWLDDRPASSDRPVFVFVNLMDAHLPYRVPIPYREKYLSSEQVARSFDISLSVYDKIVDAVDRRFNFEDRDFLDPSDREILKGQYDAGIRYLDDRVTELLDMFRQRGMLDDTLVVIVSDHGEYLDQHGQWAHRMQVYQDLLNIVIMIRPPGLTAGKRIATPAQLSDLYGTVLGATVGVENSQLAWPAIDLLAAADGDAPAERIAVSEYGGPAPTNLDRIRARNDPALNRRAVPQIAAQDGRYKLIASADGKQELFDVIEDPGEENDLLATRPVEAERLARYLTAWHERTPALVIPQGSEAPDLDPDVIRALKSLGYLGNE